MITLPVIHYQNGRPKLNEPVSMSRYGGRSISFMENGDKYWTVDIETQPLYDEELADFEAWLARARSGLETVLFSPFGKQALPRAYWNNASVTLPVGSLNTVTNGRQLLIGGVTPGQIATAGDLISLSTGDYHSMHRVTVGATAVSTAFTLTVEPPVMSYIAMGAAVTFKNPKMNARVVPGSVNVADGVLPTVKFQLIEVPK